MNKQLQAKIDEYQESYQSLREEGRALFQHLEQEGWEFIERFLDLGYISCVIHPDLWTQLNDEGRIAFDDEDAFHYLQGDLTDEEWKMIVELPVF